MADDNAAVTPAGDAGGGQEPPEVSTPEKPAQPSTDEGSSPSLEEPEKKVESPEEGNAEPSGDDGEKPKEAEPKEEDKPLHRDPAWQRQQRNVKRLRKLTGKQNKVIETLVNKMGQFMAEQKGEEFTPEKFSDEAVDFDDLLDDELESFSTEKNLSPTEEAAVAKIAREHAMDLGDGKKVPLPVKTAYAFYQASLKAEPTKEEEVPPKKEEAPKPQEPVKKENREIKTAPPKSLSDIAYAAMQEWKALNGG